MRNYFTLDGVDSRDYGVYISGQSVYSGPERDLNLISVPGRSGDLIGIERRFLTAQLSYPAFVYSGIGQKLADLRAWLQSAATYRRLIDSYHPDEFRLAVFRGPLEVKPTKRLDAGEFDITFLVKPQRFLLSGETVTTLTASGSITNPTLYPSQPLLRIYGAGVLGIGDQSITITEADGYTDVDCEMMDAFKGSQNRNTYVELSGYNFPVLSPGVNNLSLGAGISRVEITPRWWTV